MYGTSATCIGNSAANIGGTGGDTRSPDPLDRYVRPGGVAARVS